MNQRAISRNDPARAVRRIIRETSDVEFTAICEALTTQDIDHGSLVSAASAATSKMPRDVIDVALGAVVGFIGGWFGAGQPADLPIEDVFEEWVYAGQADAGSRQKLRTLVALPALVAAAAALVDRPEAPTATRIAVAASPSPLAAVSEATRELTFLLVVDSVAAPTAEVARTTFVLDRAGLYRLRESIDAALSHADEDEARRAND